MRKLIAAFAALIVASSGAAQERKCYKEELLTLIDGRTVLVKTAVPCEVQSNVKVKRCDVCGDACDCAGTCVCDREAAVRASRQPARRFAAVDEEVITIHARGETAEERCARIKAVTLWWPHNGVWTYGTVADYLRVGGDLDQVRGPSVSEVDKLFFKSSCTSAPWIPAPRAVAPVTTYHATPAYPVYYSTPTWYSAPALYGNPVYLGGDCASGNCGGVSVQAGFRIGR